MKWYGNNMSDHRPYPFIYFLSKQTGKGDCHGRAREDSREQRGGKAPEEQCCFYLIQHHLPCNTSLTVDFPTMTLLTSLTSCVFCAVLCYRHQRPSQLVKSPSAVSTLCPLALCFPRSLFCSVQTLYMLV